MAWWPPCNAMLNSLWSGRAARCRGSLARHGMLPGNAMRNSLWSDRLNRAACRWSSFGRRGRLSSNAMRNSLWSASPLGRHWWLPSNAML